MSKNDMVMVPREVAEAAWQALDDDGRFEESCPLREALDQPAQQHQAEPVAWVRFRNGEPDYDGDAVMISNVRGDTLGDGDSWEPVYTHADPAEVESLKSDKQAFAQNAVDLRAEVERLRRHLHAARVALEVRGSTFETLRAQLAEAQALLRDKSGDLIRMAAHLISAPLFALQDLQDEDKKMTRARVDHAVDVADARLKDAAYELRRIANALSASAEQEVKS